MPKDWDDVTEFFDDDWTVEATYASKTIDVIRYKSENTKDTMLAGELQEYLFTVMAKISDFTSAPTVGSLLTYDSVEYRIDAIETDSNEAVYLIYLGEKYKQ